MISILIELYLFIIYYTQTQWSETDNCISNFEQSKC